MPTSSSAVPECAAVGDAPTAAMHPTLVALGSLLAAFGIEPKPYEASKIVS